MLCLSPHMPTTAIPNYRPSELALVFPSMKQPTTVTLIMNRVKPCLGDKEYEESVHLAKQDLIYRIEPSIYPSTRTHNIPCTTLGSPS